MPDFQYRALTASGQIVSGSISACSAAEVARRIDYLGLVPIEDVVEHRATQGWRLNFRAVRKIRPEEVTIFTLDLALLLKAGARLDDALELLATDLDVGALRSSVAGIRSSILSGESFADAIGHYPDAFPAIYVALVRVGESSGTLESVLGVLAAERARAEELRRKLADALRYPTFVLFAAFGVLVFFLMFVLPQFSAVLRDFGAQPDAFSSLFLRLSDLLAGHKELFGLAVAFMLVGILLALKHQKARRALMFHLTRLPVVSTVAAYHSTALFCRNLHVLLSAAVPLPAALRILADMMANVGASLQWSSMVEGVRQGGKLADALGDLGHLPSMAVRMMRLGEESAQLPIVAGRVAEFYEVKLQRSLDRMVALIGPLAIITISVIVGGLIVSVMSSLLSVSQLVG